MNKINYIIYIAFAIISGCQEQTDLSAYVEQAKNKKPTQIEPLPTLLPYVAKKYESYKLRNPFSTPKPEVNILTKSSKTKCVQPNLERHKSELEKFSLESLMMKGTLSSSHNLTGLIADPSGFVHQVSKSDYIGLNQGIISKIDNERIEINELIPDGSGCWKNRTTAIVLTKMTNEDKSGMN